MSNQKVYDICLIGCGVSGTILLLKLFDNTFMFVVFRLDAFIVNVLDMRDDILDAFIVDVLIALVDIFGAFTVVVLMETELTIFETFNVVVLITPELVILDVFSVAVLVIKADTFGAASVFVLNVPELNIFVVVTVTAFIVIDEIFEVFKLDVLILMDEIFDVFKEDTFMLNEDIFATSSAFALIDDEFIYCPPSGKCLLMCIYKAFPEIYTQYFQTLFLQIVNFKLGLSFSTSTYASDMKKYEKIIKTEKYLEAPKMFSSIKYLPEVNSDEWFELITNT
jgi:hypothetical protein